jgi:hypothetical protein
MLQCQIAWQNKKTTNNVIPECGSRGSSAIDAVGTIRLNENHLVLKVIYKVNENFSVLDSRLRGNDVSVYFLVKILVLMFICL